MMSLNQKNNMRKCLFISLLLASLNGFGQSSTEFFNQAANEYIYINDQLALNTINNGLLKYPDDKNLTNLKAKIEKEKQKQEQKNQQQQQEQKEKQEQEQQQEQEKKQEKKEDQQSQQEQESEDNKDAEEKDQSQQAQQQETEEEGQEMDQPPQSRNEKLEELNLTEEKARMILEAMKNNEIQYIQQNRRKATKKPDSNKPDW